MMIFVILFKKENLMTIKDILIEIEWLLFVKSNKKIYYEILVDGNKITTGNPFNKEYAQDFVDQITRFRHSNKHITLKVKNLIAKTIPKIFETFSERTPDQNTMLNLIDICNNILTEDQFLEIIDKIDDLTLISIFKKNITRPVAVSAIVLRE